MPKVPVVLFTMYADNLNGKLASIVGVNVVLSKQEGVSRLREHLKALLSPNNEPTLSSCCA